MQEYDVTLLCLKPDNSSVEGSGLSGLAGVWESETTAAGPAGWCSGDPSD